MNEFLHLIVNPAHWAFELVSGAAIAATLTPLWRWMVRKHDAKRHAQPTDHHLAVYTQIEFLRMRLIELERRSNAGH